MEKVSQSPTEASFVQNPYPFYAQLRQLGHFVYWEEFGLPMATSAEAVNAVLRHPSLGRALPGGAQRAVPDHLRPFYDIEARSLLELEAPDHTRLRKLVLRAFTRAGVSDLVPVIQGIAEELIGRFPSGPFDLIEAFAKPLPVRTIAHMLGVPESKSADLLAWSNAMVAMYQARRDREIEMAAANAAMEFGAYVAGLIDIRRHAPGEDLVSQLVMAEVDGNRLSDAEIISTTILLLNAGHEATVHTIGNTVPLLIDFPARSHSLAPDRVENTVEECLRYDPPLHMFRRWVYKDVNILGQRFCAGEEIGCLLASACRDETVWPDAEQFDPARRKRPNAAFGAGIHFCVGAPLARIELQIALSTLFARCPDLRIAEPPQVANLYHFHGFERLMVRV